MRERSRGKKKAKNENETLHGASANNRKLGKATSQKSRASDRSREPQGEKATHSKNGRKFPYKKKGWDQKGGRRLP